MQNQAEDHGIRDQGTAFDGAFGFNAYEVLASVVIDRLWNRYCT